MTLTRSLALAAATILLSAPAMAQQPLPDSPIPNTPALPTPETEPPPASSSSSSEDLPKPAPHIATNPTTEVTVLEDTLIRVRTNAGLSTSMTRDGSPILFTLSEDVIVDNTLIIPRGATLHGSVVQSKRAGTLTGSPDLILKLVSLDLAGRTYPVYSYQFKVEGMSKTKPTETKIKGGAVVGAVVGGVFNGTAKGTSTAVSKLAGAGAGAAVGAGLGTLVSASAPGPSVVIPAESQMDFYLASPISVLPPTAKDAERLSHTVRTGEPVLYVRGETP
jgi:hypothetical protein